MILDVNEAFLRMTGMCPRFKRLFDNAAPWSHSVTKLGASHGRIRYEPGHVPYATDMSSKLLLEHPESCRPRSAGIPACWDVSSVWMAATQGQRADGVGRCGWYGY